MNAQPSASCGEGNPRSGLRLRFAALILLTLAAYLPLFAGGFIWDDDIYLHQNELIRSSDGLYRLWFTTDAVDYYPLSSSSLWLGWRLWGANPAPYHAGNILLHLLNAMLLWRLLCRLGVPGGWLAALLFALHPVNVEAAGWIAQRKTLMALTFALLSVDAYARSEQGGGRRSYLASLAWYVCSLLSKTSAVMTPFVFLLVAWWRHRYVNARDVARCVPFFLAAVGMGLVTVWFQSTHALAGELHIDATPMDRVAAAGVNVWFYLGKFLWPHPLGHVYPRWEIHAAGPMQFLPAALLAALAAALLFARPARVRAAGVALAVFVAMLFPMLGFWDIGFMEYAWVADHWQYAAMPALAALVAAAATLCMGSRTPALACAAKAAVALALAGLFVLTNRRSELFADEVSLWQDNIRHYPASFQSYQRLGNLYQSAGDWARAESYYRQVIELHPERDGGYANLGTLYARRGKANEALKAWDQALSLNTNNASTHLNVALAALKRGDHATAVAHYREILRINPRSHAVRLRLAWLLATSKEDSVRNGKAAREVIAAEGKSDAALPLDSLVVLGLAQAAEGDFGAAEKSLSDARAVLERARDTETVNQIDAYLEAVRAQKPFIAP